MKTTIRTLSAVIAGVLLNLGFSHSAERLDPVTNESAPVLNSEIQTAQSCAACIIPDDIVRTV